MLIDIVINSLHQVMEFLRTDLKCNFCDRFQHQMHSLDGLIGQPWIEDLVFAKLLRLYSYFHSNQTWPFIFYTARSRTVTIAFTTPNTNFQPPFLWLSLLQVQWWSLYIIGQYLLFIKVISKILFWNFILLKCSLDELSCYENKLHILVSVNSIHNWVAKHNGFWSRLI